MTFSFRILGRKLSGEAISKHLGLCVVENHMNDLGSGLYTEKTTHEKSRTR